MSRLSPGAVCVKAPEDTDTVRMVAGVLEAVPDLWGTWWRRVGHRVFLPALGPVELNTPAGNPGTYHSRGTDSCSELTSSELTQMADLSFIKL